MPVDPQIMQLVNTVAQFLPTDQNRPYTIRRKKEGLQDEHGETVGEQYDYRTIENIRTQPLGENEFNRLPEGLRNVSWRFIAVLPKVPGQLPADRESEFLDFGEQIQYSGHWYEIRFINDWDLIQHCKGMFVE